MTSLHDTAAPAGTSAPARSFHRHSLRVRICHWLNAIAIFGLIYTGMQILLDYPELYWGKTGYLGHEPALHLRELGFDLTYTSYGQHIWHIGGIDFPGDREWGRYNHFFFAWLFAVNGLVYLIGSLVSGHVRRKMVPSAAELRPRHLGREIWDHLRLHTPKGEAAREYNTLQKLSYLFVLLGLCPLVVLSGLAQSPGFVAAQPWVLDLFGGGRHTARSLHVLSMVLILLFVIIHVFEVFVAGFWNEIRSMITGRFVLPKELPPQEKSP